jgi:CheY-like chemotaxis protein
MEIESTEIDVETAVAEVFGFLRGQAQEKGLSLNMEVAPGALKNVKADPLRVRQVLLNLVGNAIKFTKVGGISVRLSDKALVNADGIVTVRLSVSDTGIGIPVEKQTQLFQKFMQADSSTTRKFGGTGLGLAICKRLVNLMGGEIGLQQDASHYKVLLAEDNPINQTLARKMLEKLGCKVDLAVNGLEAVKKLRSNKYDMVFMDCHMPEMDGYSATREIRSWESSREGTFDPIPIIALTANAFKEDELACRAAGMDDYLTKPVTRDAILQALEKWGKPVETSDQV